MVVVDFPIFVNENADGISLCKAEQKTADDTHIYGSPADWDQWAKQTTQANRELFAQPNIAASRPGQQRRPHQVHRIKPKSNDCLLHLTFNAKVKIAARRVGAQGAYDDKTTATSLMCGLGKRDHEI